MNKPTTTAAAIGLLFYSFLDMRDKQMPFVFKNMEFLWEKRGFELLAFLLMHNAFYHMPDYQSILW